MRIVLLALLFAPGIASAATYTVCAATSSTPCTYTSLTAAHLSASVVDGTILEVYGAITEASAVTITKDLTILGKGGTRPTISAATGANTLTFDSAAVASLSFVKIVPGTSRAIEVKGGSTVAFDDLLVESASKTVNGVGLYVNNGKVTVSDSTFQTLTSTSNGGAVYLTNGATTAVFDNVDFIDNKGPDGGALYADDVLLTLTDCWFSSNDATDDGGAVYLKGSGVNTSTGTTFSANTSADAGGAVYQETAPATWTTALFEDNRATGNGGALYISAGDTAFDACDFDTNAAGYGTSTAAYGGDIRAINSDILLQNFGSTTGGSADYGGSIAVDAASNLTVTDMTFGTSTAVTRGGHIYSLGDVSLTNSDFSNGTASTGGGSLAAIDAVVGITGSTFTSNKVTSTSSYTYGGGAVYAETCDTTVTDSTFTTNDSGYNGGGIYVYDQGTLDVSGSAFTSNDAYLGGGITFYSDNTAEVADTTFTSNTAHDGGGLLVWEWTGTAGLTLSDSTFTSNSVTTAGGGIYVNIGDNLAITDSTFDSNVAGATGGALHVTDTEGGATTVYRNWFCGNSAIDGGAAWFDSLSTGSVHRVANNVFVENGASDDGAGIYVYSSTTLDVLNNTILTGKAASASGGGVQTGQIDFMNNLVAYTAAGDGYAAGSSSAVLTYNGWYSNLATNVSGSITSLGATNVTGSDPLLLDYTSGDGCTGDVRVRSTSPMIDTGSTAVLDTDGTRSDIGAYGGPYADTDAWRDGDGDGTRWVYDCDDADASVEPGATETCDGVDEDCDGVIDDGATSGTTYLDADGDGYGTSSKFSTACPAPSGYVSSSTDCNDGSSAISPAATETCNGVDDDCDGTIDEAVKTTYYADTDADGFGNLAAATEACSLPTGYVTNSTDCNDGSAAVKPGATETCNGIDDDCDATVDEGVKTRYYADTDSDGYGALATPSDACSAPSGYVANSTDCNDGNAAVKPGATETCNSVDDDCDSSVDEGVTTTYYADTDSDGYGNLASPTSACSAPSGYVTNSTDCNDGSAAVKPGATETCNAVDDDCDTTVDEGVKNTYYADTDSDGYGDAAAPSEACSAPSGYVVDKTDCNDKLATVSPADTEICNAIDDDCDGSIDEAVKVTFYADSDSDGYGDSAAPTTACTAPSGYVADKTDCDDDATGTHPGAVEHCDDIDEDCDGTPDDGAIDPTSWYADGDSDGYGAGAATNACDAPTGYVADATDCDDTEATVLPDGTEFCNGVDDDCDGTIDDDVVTYTFYADTDGDGLGDASDSVEECAPPSGYVLDDSDCDDGDDAVGAPTAWYADTDGDGFGDPEAETFACDAPTDHVAAADDCDDTDDAVADGFDWYADADGDGLGDASDSVYGCEPPSGYLADATDCDDDDDTVGGPTPWYADADSDGFGDLAAPSDACDAPSGHVADATDCDDTQTNTHPGAVDQCNNEIDDDCDGEVDEEDVYVDWYADGDDDNFGDDATVFSDCAAPTGYVGVGGDCDDTTADVSPGAIEVCNGIDDNCDGDIDGGAVDQEIWYADADGDGYGAPGDVFGCEAPSGHVSEAGDCDDADADAFPGATEVCDGADDDCDGAIDEEPAGTTWYTDADEDGYGDDATGLTACDAPADAVDVGGDCDDADAGAFPGAEDVPDDGIDQDCDGADATGTVIPGDSTRDWVAGDTGEEDPAKGAGCGCGTAGGPSGWLAALTLAAALGARRRGRPYELPAP